MEVGICEFGSSLLLSLMQVDSIPAVELRGFVGKTCHF